MDWVSLRAAKEAEIQQLASTRLSEVTPSIRDFTHFVTTHKQELALIAALKRTDPDTGKSWPDRDLVALAQECDDAEVGAIGVYTEPSVFGTSLDDLRAISDVVSAPILQLDFVFHESQIHHARLCGADAVLLWADAVDEKTLESLVVTASSIHVVPVVMAQTAEELSRALAAEVFIVGIASPTGKFDSEQIAALASLVPSRKTIIALDEISTPDEAEALHGKVDAAVVSNCVLDALDVEGTLADLVQTEPPLSKGLDMP